MPGGYQQPSAPAPVSGPGALSQRTDTGPTQGARYISGGAYGDGQDLMGLQQSASMAGAQGLPQANPKAVAAAAAASNPNYQGFGGTPLGAPTERPGEPITHGAPFGAGAGPEVLPFPVATPVADASTPQQADPEADALRAAYKKNPTAYIGMVLSRLEQEGR